MTRTNRATAAFGIVLMLASAIVMGCSRADQSDTGSQPEADNRDKPTLEEFLPSRLARSVRHGASGSCAGVGSALSVGSAGPV
jgi:hypothetical protein